MSRRLALLGWLAAAACGGEGSWQRCASSAECPPGTFCDLPVSGERGVCQPPGTLALTAPAPGAYLGASAAISATLTLASASLSAPASVELRSGGTAVTALARQGVAGQVATYSGTASFGAAQDGAASLDALARVDVAGTPVPVASPAVAVTIDTVPPVIQNATAACAGGCKRDSTLAVSADATDLNLLAVAVSLDLDPARGVAVTQAGNTWSASVALGTWAFPYFQRTAHVTVRAVDRAGNEATAVLPVDVTRLRWAYASGATAVTSPAVMADGTIVFGVSAITGQLRALRPDMSEAFPPVTVGTQAVTAAPSIGPTAIWVGTEGNRVFAVSHNGTTILNGGGSGCDVAGAVRGPPALAAGTETAFVASSVGRLYAANTGTLCAAGPLTDTFTAPPVIDRNGKVLAATATATATATLRKYAFDGAAFTQEWSAQVGVNVSAPPALDASDGCWTGSQDAKLVVTSSLGVPTTIKVLAGSIIDSAVVITGGDVVVGDQARVLHRVKPDGTQVWASEPLLDGPALAPLALMGGEVTFLVPTTAGTLHAIRADGSQAWSGVLTAGQALRAGNIYHASAAAHSTAYFGSADGNLYAVIVDEQLDSSAPWPKSHHDLANTANVSSPLP